MDRDVVVGIVGAVVLVAAMVGIFFYERSVAPIPAAEGAAPSMNATSATASDTTAVGSSTEKMLALDGGNATFTLTWTPGDRSTDTLGLTVTAPDGRVSDAVESSASPIELTFAGPAGNWTVEVAFVSAEGPAGGVPGPAGGVGADTSVSWSLDAAVRP